MDKRPPSVLFVCLGNICRSPLAEAILSEIARKNGFELFVDSAGTGSWHIGEAPCDNSIKVALRHDLDIRDMRARQVGQEDLCRFDIIIGLDDKNVADLKKIGAAHVYKLGSFGYNGLDVPDPYFFPGYDGFENVFAMIETCSEHLFERLRNGLR
jgi:protein-tyrosine phosphatase